MATLDKLNPKLKMDINISPDTDLDHLLSKIVDALETTCRVSTSPRYVVPVTVEINATLHLPLTTKLVSIAIEQKRRKPREPQFEMITVAQYIEILSQQPPGITVKKFAERLDTISLELRT